ncbi:MAG: helix-turn-helix transcriptional regulator [bacterium]
MKRTLTEAVAIALTTARKNANISQEELAHRSGLDRTYISGIERGVRNITLNSLERVVNGLKIEMSVFLLEIIDELTIQDTK